MGMHCTRSIDYARARPARSRRDPRRIMKTVAEHPTSSPVASPTAASRDVMLRAYRLMVLSRRIDDKEIQLKNQSQIFFRSVAPATKPSSLLRGSRCVLASTGPTPTTATAPSVSRSGSRRWTCCCRAWAPRTTRPLVGDRCRRTGVTRAGTSCRVPVPPAHSAFRRWAAPRRRACSPSYLTCPTRSARHPTQSRTSRGRGHHE